MRYAKSRFAGAILLLLGAALILTGIFAAHSSQPGTPLYAAVADADAARAALDAANAAVVEANDALTRAGNRASDALDAASEALDAANEAVETEQSADYDPETDVGALGQAIEDARAAGEDVSAIADAYSPVYNAGLLETLSSALSEVERAEGAIEDAAAALAAAEDAARALDPDAALSEIPAAIAAETAELGDLTGTARYLTRAENYAARAQAASDSAAALSEAGSAILAEVEAAVQAHPLTFAQSAFRFARDRAVDLDVIGGVLALAGLALLLAPKKLAEKWKLPLFRKGFFFAATVALLAAALHYASGEMWDLMRQGVFDTLYMTIPATFFAYVLGLPLGVLLVITSPGHIRPNATLNSAVGTVVNFLRSIPFIILLVMLFDVTRVVMGTAIGTRSVIFPLFVSAFPYVARIVEGSLNEVDHGVIEAAESMGSTTWQIIRKVLIPEATPSLINGAAICMTTVLAYTAMAGSAGGDGLGKIAITYGLNYREYDIMYVSSLLLVALVQIIQIAGNLLMRAADHRRK